MRRTALVLAFALLATPLAAQEDTAALARQYADMPEVQALYDDLLSPEMLANQFRASIPPEVQLTDDQLARIGEVMAKMMASLRPDLTEMMVTGMAQQFSAAEISALIAFYGSPEGASVMRKLQPFMQQVMAGLVPLIQQRQQEFLPQLAAIIQE